MQTIVRAFDISAEEQHECLGTLTISMMESLGERYKDVICFRISDTEVKINITIPMSHVSYLSLEV